MNTDNTQSKNTGCCIDHCSTTFKSEEQVIVNSYKCNRKRFSSYDNWNVQRQRKQFTIGTTITVN